MNDITTAPFFGVFFSAASCKKDTKNGAAVTSLQMFVHCSALSTNLPLQNFRPSHGPVLDPTALVPHKRVDSMTATTSLTIIIFTSHKINMVHRRKSSERIYIQIFSNHQIPQNFLLIAQSKQLKRNEK